MPYSLDALTTRILQRGWNFSLSWVPPCGTMINTTERLQLNSLQCKMLCRYWKEGGREEKQHSFICFTFSLLFYILQTDTSIFCVLPTTACSLLRKLRFFQPNFVFLPSACPKEPLHSSMPLPQPILLFPLHTVLPAFMSLYCYLYSFELLLVFTLLCKHAERINTHFQRLYPSDHLTT